MPWIRFARHSFKDFEVPVGSHLMEVLLEHQVPVASSCGGEAICGKCAVIVIDGFDGLSFPTPVEDEVRERQGVPLHQRISCQCFVYADITLDTLYW